MSGLRERTVCGWCSRTARWLVETEGIVPGHSARACGRHVNGVLDGLLNAAGTLTVTPVQDKS